MARSLPGAPLEPGTHAVRRKAEHRADADARQLSTLGRLVDPALRRTEGVRNGIDIPERVRVHNRRKLTSSHLHSIVSNVVDSNMTLSSSPTQALLLALAQLPV